MQLQVVVTTPGPVPEPGVPVHVQVRDTSVADAGAVVVAAATEPFGESASTGEGAHGTGAPGRGTPLAALVLDLPDDGAPQDWTVWAHVRAAGTPGVSTGDWITVQSYPVTSAAGRESETGESVPCVEVEVVQI